MSGRQSGQQAAGGPADAWQQQQPHNRNGNTGHASMGQYAYGGQPMQNGSPHDSGSGSGQGTNGYHPQNGPGSNPGANAYDQHQRSHQHTQGAPGFQSAYPVSPRSMPAHLDPHMYNPMQQQQQQQHQVHQHNQPPAEQYYPQTQHYQGQQHFPQQAYQNQFHHQQFQGQQAQAAAQHQFPGWQAAPPSVLQPYAGPHGQAQGYGQGRADDQRVKAEGSSDYQAGTGQSERGEVEDEAEDNDELGDGELDGNSQQRGKAQASGQVAGQPYFVQGPGQKGTSDFVKKLFKMLDDDSYATIVGWGAIGDSFVVKNMNDFTKRVLPRHFRHSNFASFVRQLNKYDFHKVKNPEEASQVGADQVWEFKHPDFVRGREDLLENVKRKLPAGKKGGAAAARAAGAADSGRDSTPAVAGPSETANEAAEGYAELKSQVQSLTAYQDTMNSHINGLTKQYQGVIGEMLTFQRNMIQQDQLMQNLIQYLMNLEADRKGEPSTKGSLGGADGPFVPSNEAQKLITSYADVARASFTQMNEIARRASLGITMTPQGNQPHASGSGTQRPTQSGATTRSASGQSSHNSQDPPLSPRSTTSVLPSRGSTPAGDKAGNGGAKATSQFPDSRGAQTEKGTPNGEATLFLHPPHFDAEDSDGVLNAAANVATNPSLAAFEGAGLRVYTVGTLQPREDNEDYLSNNAAESGPSGSALDAAFSKKSTAGTPSQGDSRAFGISVPHLEQLPASMPRVDKRSSSANNTPIEAGATARDDKSPTPQDRTSSPEGSGNMLRVRRSTFVPGWAVPPRVLLVDDDAVCRKLSSKFLQVFGCAIDVAVDGVNAVNKMNLEKYDLVLMDIVMPNLDGVSATSLIRQFDPRTPIISMTSNSDPKEIFTYFSHGMNDILPKPFTKEGLLSMLEKHLIHLKTIQQMDEIPKALGLPPVSDGMLQNALTNTAVTATTMNGGAGVTPSPGGGTGPSPLAAIMGNGTEALNSDAASLGSESEDGVVNPLAGMGFSDEEYISMLQNLIAAGSVSDSVRGSLSGAAGSVMGVMPGEGTSGTRSVNATPSGAGASASASALASTSSGFKRPAHELSTTPTGEHDAKRSRFMNIQ